MSRKPGGTEEGQTKYYADEVERAVSRVNLVKWREQIVHPSNTGSDLTGGATGSSDPFGFGHSQRVTGYQELDVD